MKQLNSKQLFAVNEVFGRLNCLRRWTSCSSEKKYNELSKQALNNIVLYLLASFAEADGMIITWERFPKIALYRAFQKAYVVFDIPQTNFDMIFELGNIPKDALNVATNFLIEQEADHEFMKFLSEGLGTNEMRLYRAATKIATNIELMELSYRMNPRDYRQKSIEINDSLREFEDLPGFQYFTDVDGEIFNFLIKIASLRNTTRWAAQYCGIDCSVLGHSFDTAVFAYVLGLEEYSGDEAISTQMFFLGLYHDIAEMLTGDIPSTIKDLIEKLREAAEAFEQFMMEGAYSKLPDLVVQRIRVVMMDSEANTAFKKLIKGADYLSADSECWREGIFSKDDYFEGAIQRRKPGIESGKVLLTNGCSELHEFYAICAELTEKTPRNKEEAEKRLQEKRNLSELAKMTPVIKMMIEANSILDEKLAQLDEKKAKVEEMIKVLDEKLAQLEEKK